MYQNNSICKWRVWEARGEMLSKHCRATAAGQHHLKHTLEIKECKQFLGITRIDLFTNKHEQWDRQLARGRHDIGISFHVSPSPGCEGYGLNGGKERGWGWQTNALLLKDRAHRAPLLPTAPISHVTAREEASTHSISGSLQTYCCV